MDKIEISLLRNNTIEIYGAKGVLEDGDLERFHVELQYNISGYNSLNNIIPNIPHVPINLFEVQKRLKKFIDDRSNLIPDEEYRVIIEIYNEK